MKTLHLVASPPTGGESRTLSPEDRELALELGRTINLGYIDLEAENPVESATGVNRQRQFDRLFYAPLPQAVETALWVCQGLGYTPRLMLPIPGLGDEPMLGEIFTEEFRKTVAGGMTELSASLKVHSIGQSKAWAERSMLALISIFDSMAEGETAIGFSPLVVILLTAWAFAANDETRGAWTKLKSPGAMIFVCRGDGDCLPYAASVIEIASGKD